MRLEGVAYLPEPDEHPETWKVPKELWLKVNFHADRVIGRVALEKLDDGTINAVAQVPEEAVVLPVRENGRDSVRNITRAVLAQYPKFAVGIAGADLEQGAEVVSVSVVEENANPLIEPYRVVEDEVPAEGQ